MENKYRCDVCKDSGAVKTGEYEYSECPCVSDDRNFTVSAKNARTEHLKFTKGKWKAERKSENQTCHLVKTGDKYTVHVYDSKYGIEESESWENAKLIAKAPALLKMLKKVTDELEFYAGNEIMKHPLINESRKLIKL